MSNNDSKDLNNSEEGKAKGTPKQDIPNDSIIPDEILNSIPEKDRPRFIKETTSMIMGNFPRKNPLSDKITPEHITSIIVNSDSQDKRDREERKDDKIYNIVLVLIMLGFSIFLIIFLKDEKELLEKLFYSALGFGGGFGIGKFYNKKDNS